MSYVMDYKGYADLGMVKWSRRTRYGSECMCDTCMAAVSVAIVKWLLDLVENES